MGSGSFGAVFRAWDREKSKAVAIKAMNASNSAQQLVQGIDLSVIREAAFLLSLRHENIIKVSDIFMLSGQTHLVMELCEMNLREYMNQLRAAGGMTVEASRVRHLIRQLLSAVHHCHDRNILHRDLKVTDSALFRFTLLSQL